MTTLSILDLCPITEGSDASTALRNALDLAQHAERWGYHRYWVAEHHNMRGIASAATAVVIGHIAGGTSTIRVGAGGIMLPNHAPLVIAEHFGTLAAIYPGRIDLGLGRAPGTDQVTAQALRRHLHSDCTQFPRDVVELQHYFREPREGQHVQAVPGSGENVPLWILGSSLFGAHLAAALGLPFAFASHFAPGEMWNAIEVYRDKFEPSEQLEEPYYMLGYNVCAADTADEAQFLRTSAQQSFVRLRRGMPGRLPPPVENFEETLTPADREVLNQMQSCSVAGDPDTVRREIDSFLEQTGANELTVVSSTYDTPSPLPPFPLT
ncbi:MAG: LLM class flavin-dependent oxidoreductase, partial [Pseudomonadales bacterium]|nr:LLM class flavin-dependent oxidoreductase [Pseudomonadales bacterium]